MNHSAKGFFRSDGYLPLLVTTALAPMLWGTTYIVTTEFLPPDRPLWAACLRTLPAGLLLLLWRWHWPNRAQLWRVIALSFLTVGAFQALLFVAAYRLPGGIAAVITSLQSLVIVVLLWAVDGVRPSKLVVAALLASTAGLAMLLMRTGAHWDTVGLLAGFACAVVFGAGIYLTQRWQMGVPNLTFTAWQLFFGGLMLLPLAVVFETWPAHITATNLLGYAYLALLGSLLAYALFYRGIAALPAIAVSVLGVFSPITATLLGWWLLGESLSPRQLAGLIIVLVAVVVIQWKTRRKPHATR